jgi:hypothetical protein
MEIIMASRTASTKSFATSQSLYAYLISMMIMHDILMITKSYRKRNSAFNIFLRGEVLEADSDTYGQQTPCLIVHHCGNCI